MNNPDIMPDSAVNIHAKVTDLSLKIVALAEQEDADVTALYNALAMTFITSYVASRTSEGHDVEEDDLVRAVVRFTDMLASMGMHLLNFSPEILKSEISNKGE